MKIRKAFRLEGSKLVVTLNDVTCQLPAGPNASERLQHVIRAHLEPGEEAIGIVMDAFEVESVSFGPRKSRKQTGDAT